VSTVSLQIVRHADCGDGDSCKFVDGVRITRDARQRDTFSLRNRNAQCVILS
jgi:hypothetical protein